MIGLYRVFLEDFRSIRRLPEVKTQFIPSRETAYDEQKTGTIFV